MHMDVIIDILLWRKSGCWLSVQLRLAKVSNSFVYIPYSITDYITLGAIQRPCKREYVAQANLQLSASVLGGRQQVSTALFFDVICRTKDS